MKAAKMPVSTYDFAAALRDYEEAAWRMEFRAQSQRATAADLLAVDCAEITGCDLVALARYAFRHSVQIGSLVNHQQLATDELVDVIAAAFVAECADHQRLALDMEWVMSRAVRLLVLRASDDAERWFVSNVWPDHTAEQLAALVAFARSTVMVQAVAA